MHCISYIYIWCGVIHWMIFTIWHINVRYHNHQRQDIAHGQDHDTSPMVSENSAKIHDIKSATWRQHAQGVNRLIGRMKGYFVSSKYVQWGKQSGRGYEFYRVGINNVTGQSRRSLVKPLCFWYYSIRYDMCILAFPYSAFTRAVWDHPSGLYIWTQGGYLDHLICGNVCCRHRALSKHYTFRFRPRRHVQRQPDIWRVSRAEQNPLMIYHKTDRINIRSINRAINSQGSNKELHERTLCLLRRGPDRVS